jgi:hypothetical protein
MTAAADRKRFRTTVAGDRERLRLASALGLAVLALAVALVPLSILARQNPLANGGETLIVAPFAAVGFVLAWRRPGNPIGWLSLAVAGCFLLSTDSGFYAALIYRQGRHLPLGPAALLLYELWGPALGALLLVIMLFPDGRLSPGFWRWVWWASSALLALFLVALAVATIGVIAGHRIRLDTFDGLTAIDHPTGWFAAAQTMFSLLGVLVLVGCVARQLVNWRRSSGERRQQLKWLASGAVVGVTCLIVGLATGGDTAPAVLVASGIATVGVAALPVSMGVAILKYRLYDIDRIISRTLAYAMVTGVLLGFYAGLVLLATEVLRFSSPVAVAASTLAAAALFTPLRRRVQRAVDRRFNRARYDADRTVAAFAARLQDAVNLDTVHADLVRVVGSALEPARVSVWLAERDR